MRPFGKTFVKTILREIRSSLGRFLAIFAIVALGTGFLTGLVVTTPNMRYSMDRYFDGAGMMDLNIKGALGLTAGDAAALRASAEVERLLPARVQDVEVAASTDEVLAARIYGIPLEDAFAPGAVNRLELLSGRVPENPGECLAEQGGGYFSRFPLGTVIRILPEGKSPGPPSPEGSPPDGGGDFAETETFRVREFTVTGIVKSPLYISTEREPSRAGNGRIGAALYVREEAWALPVYTDFFVLLRGAGDSLSFTDGYQALVDAGTEAMDALGRARAPLREAEVREGAMSGALERLAQAEAAYLEGREQAERELAAARIRLEEVAEQIAGAEAELARGEERLEEERRRIETELAENEAAALRGEEELAAARIALADARARLDENRDRVEQTRSSWFRMLFGRAREGVAEYDRAVTQYEEGLARLREETRRLEEGKRLLAEGRSVAEAEFAGAERELSRGKAELDRGMERLAGGRREFETRRREAEAELADAERRIREGRRDIQNLEIPESRWYVLDRNTNVGAVTYGMNIRKIADLSGVFPLFFMLVAALVVLTTMTRMVEEERGRIGALKALGYRKKVISLKYLFYCGITGILGSAAGMAAGFRLLPVIIYNAFGTMYHLPPPVTRLDWKTGLASCGLVLACTTGATVAACIRTLREKPAALLMPRAPRPGKRIFLEHIPFIWRPLKFTYKVTARNLLRYKTHFFMTVTGIAGCTALMLTAFGIRDSLVDIARTQFTRILKYDLRLELRDGEGPDRDLGEILSRFGEESWTALASRPGYIADGRSRYSAVVHVPRDRERLGGFVSLKHRLSRQELPFPDDAVIITEKMAELLGAERGAELILEDTEGKQAAFTVTGVTENYPGCPVYLGPASWERLFGRAESFPLLFIKTGITGGAERDRTIAEILACETAAGAEFTSSAQESWNRLLFAISFVVLVLIAAAGGLGGTVLFNLTNINISERVRELATLRVLGFRRGEAASYIFREITILTIIGAAAGLLLGIPLHGFIISVAENPDLMFGRTIAARSYLFSALFTILFSVPVDFFMLRKINRISMTESLKSPD